MNIKPSKPSRRNYAKGGDVEEDDAWPTGGGITPGMLGYKKLEQMTRGFPGWPTMGPLSPPGGGN